MFIWMDPPPPFPVILPLSRSILLLSERKHERESCTVLISTRASNTQTRVPHTRVYSLIPIPGYTLGYILGMETVHFYYGNTIKLLQNKILRLEIRDPQNELAGRIFNKIFAELLFLNVLLLIKTMLGRNILLFLVHASINHG